MVKQPRRDVDHPPIPPSAEVKEEVQPYLYCPSGSSWSVPGQTLPFSWPYITLSIAMFRVNLHCFPPTTHDSLTNNSQNNSLLSWYQSTCNAGTNNKMDTVRVCVDSFSADQNTPQFHKITISTILITNVSHWPYPEQVQTTPLSQLQPGFDPKPVRVRHVVDTVATGQSFPQVLRFALPESPLHRFTHTHTHFIHLPTSQRRSVQDYKQKTPAYLRSILILSSHAHQSLTSFHIKIMFLFKRNSCSLATHLSPCYSKHMAFARPINVLIRSASFQVNLVARHRCSGIHGLSVRSVS